MARVLRLEAGERFPFVLNDAREFQEELATVLRGEGAPRAVERFAGRIDRRFGVRLACLGDFCEDLVTVRIVDRKGLPRDGRDELAANEETAFLDVRHDRSKGDSRVKRLCPTSRPDTEAVRARKAL